MIASQSSTSAKSRTSMSGREIGPLSAGVLSGFVACSAASGAAGGAVGGEEPGCAVGAVTSGGAVAGCGQRGRGQRLAGGGLDRLHLVVRDVAGLGVVLGAERDATRLRCRAARRDGSRR